MSLMTLEEQPFLTAIERFVSVVFPRAMLPNFPYAVPPLLTPPRPKTFRDQNFRRFRRFRR
jgi:hypothetical protein